MKRCRQQTGETLLYSEKPDDDSSGVGLMLYTYVKKRIVNWKAIADRIMYSYHPELQQEQSTLHIQVHAPTQQIFPDEEENFICSLTKLVKVD